MGNTALLDCHLSLMVQRFCHHPSLEAGPTNGEAGESCTIHNLITS